MAKYCIWCGEKVEEITYSLGKKWMHVAAGASFPSAAKGTAWWHCKVNYIATPNEGQSVRGKPRWSFDDA